jgi:hypothetical protein
MTSPFSLSFSRQTVVPSVIVSGNRYLMDAIKIIVTNDLCGCFSITWDRRPTRGDIKNERAHDGLVWTVAA